MAEQQQNPNAIATCEMGLAKVFGHMNDTNEPNHIDFKQAKSMQDVGRKLLQSVGFASPDDVSIQAAIEANDAFIERLEAIRGAAQGRMIDQDD